MPAWHYRGFLPQYVCGGAFLALAVSQLKLTLWFPGPTLSTQGRTSMTHRGDGAEITWELAGNADLRPHLRSTESDSTDNINRRFVQQD